MSRLPSRWLASVTLALGVSAAGLALPACGGGSEGSVSQNPTGTGGATGTGGGGGSSSGKGGASGSGGAAAGPSTSCKDASTCAGGKACCNGVCTDTKADAKNCGMCGSACPGAGTGDIQCAAGTCKTSCAMGKADCNGSPADGCEAVLANDKANCGKCGTTCLAANGDGVCNAGTCAIASCKQGHGDCDKDATNGCEADFDHDPKNCGVCGTACAAPPNAVPTCALGKCATTLTCKTGFQDCNGKIDDGCEVDVTKDPTHCGTCGTVCPSIAHGKPACTMGACAIGSCDAGFGDCNKSLFDGCEAQLDVDAQNCGSCGQKCVQPAGGQAACVASKCALGGCSAGFADCDKNPANGCETDLSSDVAHCGACGIACQAPANGKASCSMFQCGIGSCTTGFAHCVGPVSSGCETSLSSLAHCGSCTNACPALPHATGLCSNAACLIASCDAAFKDCNNKPADGCEVSIADDVKNCGKCGNACVAPKNATAGCATGTCGIGACLPGFHDCNATAADGCEQATSGDPQNCGGCGVVCGSGSCTNSACICAPTVLLIGDDNAVGTATLKAAIAAAGLAVTVSPVPVWQYDGTNPAPTGFGAVVLLAGTAKSSSTDMPVAGQSAIAAFVAASNGLVVTEWAALLVSNNLWQTLSPLVLLNRSTSFTGQVDFNVDPAFMNHPLWAGLPASFTVSSTVNVGLAKNIAGVATVAKSTSAAGDMVAIRDIAGSGRLVHVAHAGNYVANGWSNPNLQTLIANAANWAARCK